MMSVAKSSAAIAFAVFVGMSRASGADGDAIDFNRDIRPILSDKCFFCHGPDEHERKADLRLDTRQGAMADLGGYAAIIPGNANDSEFVFRITSDDPDELMPPEKSHKKLDADEIDLLTRWIEEGAEYSAAWAYVPPEKTPLPEVKDSTWPANWIDRFVLAKLETEDLSPSPDADRVTLIRRLYFDLTGLPPTPEAVAAFVAAEGDLEEVWGKLVDELLASPRFGERLASYWLDLVRYADTVGYHGDQDHSISPYRDYVVDALNANLPFDQFTREQLAGDLLPNPTLEQRIATGYNRLLQTSHEGGVQEKEYMAIYAADRVRNVSNVWMGGTLGCAQCHDHKYDPYTTKDFYSMVALFADVDENAHLNSARRKGLNFNALPSPRPPEMEVPTAEQQDGLAKLQAERKKAEAAGTDLKAIDKKIAELNKGIRKTMVTVALEEPRIIRILPRGNWLDDSGEIVAPAIPEFLGKLDTGKGRATRLDLANWFTDVESGSGGLTARVFANRFWYLFFGTGISRSLDDFGGQGEPPANPQLLDNLAVAFYENGWDIKALVRLIVTSRAYRQSSLASTGLLERDPYNQLTARQSRFRLPAEMIRDNALAVSGLLVLEQGGLPAKPYQPAGYYRHLNFPTRKYQAHLDSRQWRRGLYVHWQRQFLHPMMKAMDAPSREECTAQRPRSNTPTAALVLLNDPTFVEAARAFAARILTEGGPNSESQLNFAYHAALSRPPDDAEHDLMIQLLASTHAEYHSNPEAAKELLKTGIAPLPDGVDAVKLATWTAVARAILNLSETITRN
jgi:hypothetical protein